MDTVSLIKKYFPTEQWSNAYKIMQQESGGNPGAVGDTNTPYPSYGLFQIRNLPGRGDTSKLSPEENVAYAAQLYNQSGWQPWYNSATKLGLLPGANQSTRMITIRNAQTGETKQVPESGLGEYGITATGGQGGLPPINQQTIQGNVAATLGKPAQQFAQGQQDITKNANEIAKQSLDLQQQAFQTDQTLAPKVLGIDLQNRMTLEDAVNKYVSKGYMKFNDVLGQYNSYNTTAKGGYGAAKQSQAQLDQLNPTKEGVQRKQDAISGITLIRSLRDAWDNYRKNPADATARNEYLSIKNTLTDPSSNYGKLVAQYRASFPDPNNPLSWIGADGSFRGAEETVLNQSGGYTYKMLGLDNPYQKQGGKGAAIPSAVKSIGDAFFPANTQLAQSALSQQQQDTANLPNAKGNLGQAAANAATATGDLAKNTLLNKNTPGALKEDAITGAVAALFPALAGKLKPPKGSGGAMQKITAPFMKAGKYLTTTKGKELAKMNAAVEKGGDLSWDTIVKNARADIANKGVPAKKALEKLINQETPAKLGSPKLSSSEGFELRKGLGARMPSNVFERALQKASTGAHVPQNQAIESLRRAVSSELKRAAPDITNPDEMYTLIKNMKGDIPSWIKRGVASYVLSEVSSKLKLPSPVQSFLDILPEALGIVSGG